jgi:hypothetical protein
MNQTTLLRTIIFFAMQRCLLNSLISALNIEKLTMVENYESLAYTRRILLNETVTTSMSRKKGNPLRTQ